LLQIAKAKSPPVIEQQVLPVIFNNSSNVTPAFSAVFLTTS
jgi:hypothetical protein